MSKEYSYNDIIEYEDNTRDLNFEAARNWASKHNATFEELIDRRENRTIEIEGENVTKLYRYFQIKERPQLTQEESDRRNKFVEISFLKNNLKNSDYVALKLAEATAEKNDELVNSLLQEYSEVLENRKAWRNRLNELLSQE